MTKLTTFKQAAELVEHDPENEDYKVLFLAALNLANEQSELEFRAAELGDRIIGLIEQMNRFAAAKKALRKTEIRTGIGS